MTSGSSFICCQWIFQIEVGQRTKFEIKLKQFDAAYLGN
jgi:hypothetical protein